MIGIRVSQFKDSFFDRLAVINAVDKADIKNLSFLGAKVRRTAKGLIRKVGKKGEPSKPGTPPKSRTGILKDFIFFGWDAQARSVVIGPAKLGGKIGNAPQALEQGGESTVMVRRQGKKMKKTVNIQARPFMQPAADKELKQIPVLWANSVK